MNDKYLGGVLVFLIRREGSKKKFNYWGGKGGWGGVTENKKHWLRCADPRQTQIKISFEDLLCTMLDRRNFM